MSELVDLLKSKGEVRRLSFAIRLSPYRISNSHPAFVAASRTDAFASHINILA